MSSTSSSCSTPSKSARSPRKTGSYDDGPRNNDQGPTIVLRDSTFNALALDVSYAAVNVSSERRSSPDHSAAAAAAQRRLSNVWEIPKSTEDDLELWEDIGVVEYLDRKLGSIDESTPEERVAALREVLAETDIHEGDGNVSDFLFHVARTKHGRIYIRVIRTLLLNRGTVVNDGGRDGSGDAISMELMADHYCLNVQRPFDPEAHGLSPEFRLTKFGDLRNSRGMKPGRDETRTILRVFDEDSQDEDRQNHEQIVTSWEETTVTRLDRMGLHLIETNDVLCPILDDPYLMGKIACANVLSGIYCLGVVDCASSRMILAISNRLEEAERDVVVPMMIRGYRDAARSVGTIVRGVRPISNPWCMIGGTASAVCSYHEIVPPDGATVGDVIVLTKPLGTMVAIMVNQWMQQSERRSRLLLTITEDDVRKAHCRAVDSMVRTNRLAAILMRKYNAHAACEVAVHGILGHSEILARRQKNPVSFVIHNIPIIAKMSGASKVTGNVMPLLQGLMPEVSGGLLVVLPREQAAAYCKVLERSERRQAWIVGIVESGDRTARVIDRPRVIEVPAKDTGSSLW